MTYEKNVYNLMALSWRDLMVKANIRYKIKSTLPSSTIFSIEVKFSLENIFKINSMIFLLMF